MSNLIKIKSVTDGIIPILFMILGAIIAILSSDVIRLANEQGINVNAPIMVTSYIFLTMAVILMSVGLIYMKLNQIHDSIKKGKYPE